MRELYGRRYPRFPYERHCLYESGKMIYKALFSNISEGGAMLVEAPVIPRGELVSLLLDLPKLPPSTEGDIIEESSSRLILRASLRMLRHDEVKGSFAGSFLNPSASFKSSLSLYLHCFNDHLMWLVKKTAKKKPTDDEFLAVVQRMRSLFGSAPKEWEEIQRKVSSCYLAM